MVGEPLAMAPSSRRRPPGPWVGCCRQRLVLLSRWPAPGRCKRRLAADLGPFRAAAIQGQLTAHGLATARALAAAPGSAGIERLLVTDGLGPRAARRWGRQMGMERGEPQGPGALGLRLQRQVVRARRAGIRQLVLIGADLPALETADLAAAFTALRRSPLVLGPAEDGGYWLIGLDLAHGGWAASAWAPLFCGLPWGSARVLALTLERAAALGLAVTLVAQRPDLDRRQDLARWRQDPAWGPGGLAGP